MHISRMAQYPTLNGLVEKLIDREEELEPATLTFKCHHFAGLITLGSIEWTVEGSSNHTSTHFEQPLTWHQPALVLITTSHHYQLETEEESGMVENRRKSNRLTNYVEIGRFRIEKRQ